MAAITPYRSSKYTKMANHFQKGTFCFRNVINENNIDSFYWIFHHFASLLGEIEGVREDINVCGPFKLIPAVGGDVELDVISLQQRHLGLGVLLTKWEFFLGETNPSSDTTRKRVILLGQENKLVSNCHPKISRLLDSKLSSSCLIFSGNLWNDLDNSAFKLLDADIFKDDRSLRQQPHVGGYFFTLLPQENTVNFTSFGQSSAVLELLHVRCTAYISVLDGKFHIISSLQSFQVPLVLAVVKEDFFHNIGPFNEPKSLLKDNRFHGLHGGKKHALLKTF